MFPDLTRDDVFRLETQRLWLRWPRASDAAAIRRIVSRAEIALQTAEIPHPYPVGGAEAFILAARAANAEGRAIDLAITLKTTRELVGQISARFEAGEIGVGYVLAPDHWGQGYASEALAALVDVVFALTFAPRIHARAATSDVALAQVLAKQGFLDAGEETIDAPPRGGALRCRRFGLERTTREGLRLRRVPAMSQQSLTQRSVDAPAALRAHAAAPEPGAARGWM